MKNKCVIYLQQNNKALKMTIKIKPSNTKSNRYLPTH